MMRRGRLTLLVLLTVLISATRVEAASQGDDLTFFELATAMAFTLFAAQRVEVSVIEVGLDRPRARVSAEFLRLRASILEMLHFTGQSEEGA